MCLNHGQVKTHTLFDEHVVEVHVSAHLGSYDSTSVRGMMNTYELYTGNTCADSDIEPTNVHSGDTITLLVRKRGARKVIAFVQFGICAPPDGAGVALYVFELHVHISCRRLGIGTKLLCVIDLISHHLKCTGVGLTVLSCNVDAMRLYKCMGYTAIEHFIDATPPHVTMYRTNVDPMGNQMDNAAIRCLVADVCNHSDSILAI
jgi:hypothetical protein